MHILDLIKQIEQRIDSEIDRPVVRNQYAWWLLERCTGRTKSNLIVQHDVTLSAAQEAQLDHWLHQINVEHKPLAYIFGDVPFGPLTIQVKPPVLIPRMETEEWALAIVERIQQQHLKNLRILDLCCGSGCIAALFAHALPYAEIWAADICPDAIALTNKNKQALQLNNITIMQSDLFAALPKDAPFDLIVSNPPYITSDEYQNLDVSVRSWEHEHALRADDHGLALIKKIIAQAPSYLRPHRALADAGINQLFIEIGWQQGPAVADIMQKNDWHNVMISKDSAGKDRVVQGSISNVALAQ